MFQLGVFKLEMKKIPEKMSILSYIREHSSNQKDKNWRAYTKLLQEVLRDKDTETEASMLIAIDDLDKHGLYSNSDFFECIRKKWKFYVMFTTNDDRVTKEAVKIIDDPKGKTRIAHIEISLN